MSQCRGFQFMLILDLWGISFHPVVVVGLGNDLLFNFIVGHCDTEVSFETSEEKQLSYFQNGYFFKILW